MSAGKISDQVLQWLLEPSNPSVRYWTLTEIQEKDHDDPEVLKTRDAIMASDCVRSILQALKPDGHWESYDNMYLPKYTATTHNLLILAEFGAIPNKEIQRVIEYVYLFQRESGHFLMDIPKTDKGRASKVKDGCCYDGNLLYYLIHFGYLDDPRTQRLIQFQIDYHSGDVGGWKCRAFPINPDNVFPVNCFMGGAKMLKALASIPSKKRSTELRKIIDREAEVILENQIYKYLRDYDGSRKAKAGWKRFGFPLFYQSDVLEVLDVLTKLGIRDSRLEDAISLVESLRGTDGTWLLKNTYNGKMLCEIDKKNEPSKWITLRAAGVLKRYYGK